MLGTLDQYRKEAKSLKKRNKAEYYKEVVEKAKMDARREMLQNMLVATNQQMEEVLALPDLEMPKQPDKMAEVNITTMEVAMKEDKPITGRRKRTPAQKSGKGTDEGKAKRKKRAKVQKLENVDVGGEKGRGDQQKLAQVEEKEKEITKKESTGNEKEAEVQHKTEQDKPKEVAVATAEKVELEKKQELKEGTEPVQTAKRGRQKRKSNIEEKEKPLLRKKKGEVEKTQQQDTPKTSRYGRQLKSTGRS